MNGMDTRLERFLEVRTKQRVLDILSDIQCPPYEYRVYDNISYVTIQAVLWREDIDTGQWGFGKGREYLIPPSSSDDFIVKTALKAALDYAEHETRENFLYQGERIFGPHIPLRAAKEAACQK